MDSAIDEPRERAAAIERILAERRRERVATSIELEPAYVVQAIGRRPAGLRARLEWERAVDRVERLRQRLGVSDAERALGVAPGGAHQRRSRRGARRELDLLRAHVGERSAGRERGHVAEIGLER
ncbi:MAG: hypothetical protein ACRDLO_15235 [Solirubrobacterales bacterium]